MVIIDTFAVLNESLFAVQFEGSEHHELQRVFDEWNSVDFLYAFFEEHEKDLMSGYYDNITIEDAIRRTRVEAKSFQKKLYSVAIAGQSGKSENLSTLFKPLTSGELTRKRGYEKNKAYGPNKQSWLRLYAVRVNVNLFVVCGGAIKLTDTMNEREHLLKELQKLEVTKKYLETDEEASAEFYELSI